MALTPPPGREGGGAGLRTTERPAPQTVLRARELGGGRSLLPPPPLPAGAKKRKRSNSIAGAGSTNEPKRRQLQGRIERIHVCRPASLWLKKKGLFFWQASF